MGSGTGMDEKHGAPTDDGLTGRRTPLGRDDWRYVAAPTLDALSASDWSDLVSQGRAFFAEHQARAALRQLEAASDEPSFGYQINTFRHCLQAATLAAAAGLDEETVVVALLHDIAFTVSPTNHGPAAATLLGPYIGAANRWMLAHHQEFQDFHVAHLPAELRGARERWRGHPHFEWTARFVAEFDQTSLSADRPTLPLAAFEPMVRRLFATPPQPVPLDPSGP